MKNKTTWLRRETNRILATTADRYREDTNDTGFDWSNILVPPLISVVLLTLKLIGVVDLPLLVVLLPTIALFAMLLFVGVVGLCVVAYNTVNSFINKRRQQ